MEADISSVRKTIKVVKRKKEGRKTTGDLPRGADSIHIFFEAVPAVYYPTADVESEEELTQDEEDCFLDEEDDFVVESLKRAGGKKQLKKGGSSTKTVRLHDNRKLLKRESNVSENSARQKANIEDSLAKRQLKRTGLEMYFRRTAPAVKPAPLYPSTRQPKARSSYQRPPQGDHPSVKQYELRKGNIPSGMDYLNLIADLQHRDITPEDYDLLLALDESLAPKTISEDKLNTIDTVTVETLGISGELCSICMEQYRASDLAKMLPCQHHFHASCINQWLSTASQNCPLDSLAVVVS